MVILLSTATFTQPVAPTLSSPTDGAVNQPHKLTLVWNASATADTYHLQVSANSDFTTTVYDQSQLTATSQLIEGLSYSTTYYWKVAATNGSGTSAFSPISSFTTWASPDGPAPVNLKSLNSFAVLANSAITNVGTSNITGNVGLTPTTGAAITNLTQAEVTGTIYKVDATGPAGSVEDAPRLTQAMNDLTDAYNDAAGRTENPITIDGNIGGQTLYPGLYKSGAALEISTGDLTLDANGNEDAVWIFQIGTTFSMSDGKKVILLNGAKAGNIFWQVGDAATFNGTSEMKGTIMAGTAITFITGATLEGRAFAKTAAITLGANTINIPLTRFELTIAGTEGWRMLSSPTSDNKYSDLLGSIWTQGFTGADNLLGDANVQTFSTGTNSFGAIANLADPMIAGKGFITYVYSDDDYTNSTANAGFPKTLLLYGTENEAIVSVNASLNTVANKWTLVGNPFGSTISWGALDKTNLTEVVYVYDHSYDPVTIVGDVEDTSSATGNYRVWNGTTGSLTDGKIAAFQGFWVQNAAATPSLTFTWDSKTTGGTFYKQSTQSASFRMIAQMDGRANDAYFSFTNEGEIGKDNFDGLKLSPLDYADYLSLGTEVDGVLMDINNLPLDIKENTEFPVEINSFKKIEGGYALKGGEVTLSLADLKNIPAEWGIVFNNYNTGETIDLRAQESYTFQLAAKAKMVKEKMAFSVLTPMSVTREKSVGNSGFSITIQPEKTPVNLEPKDEPNEFALQQNYPNPFNPSTTIKYSVAEMGPVNLAVFNIMGQKVMELVNSTKQAGNYAISWQAQDMASGLYFYRLSAAGQTITRQMTLIK